jgi:hypothetical protein
MNVSGRWCFPATGTVGLAEALRQQAAVEAARRSRQSKGTVRRRFRDSPITGEVAND